MSPKLKKAIILALAAFLSAVTGYNVGADALELLCQKAALCEVVK